MTRSDLDRIHNAHIEINEAWFEVQENGELLVEYYNGGHNVFTSPQLAGFGIEEEWTEEIAQQFIDEINEFL